MKNNGLANPQNLKRCEKFPVMNGAIIGSERTGHEQGRSRKDHKSFGMSLLCVQKNYSF